MNISGYFTFHYKQALDPIAKIFNQDSHFLNCRTFNQSSAFTIMSFKMNNPDLIRFDYKPFLQYDFSFAVSIYNKLSNRILVDSGTIKNHKLIKHDARDLKVTKLDLIRTGLELGWEIDLLRNRPQLSDPKVWQFLNNLNDRFVLMQDLIDAGFPQFAADCYYTFKR